MRTWRWKEVAKNGGELTIEILWRANVYFLEWYLWPCFYRSIHANLEIELEIESTIGTTNQEVSG